MAMPYSDNPLEPQPLLALTSKADYASRVSEIVHRVSGASDEAEAVELLAEAATRLGADLAVFASFARDDGSHEAFRFLLACDPVWCHEYERVAWYANDPWLLYALRQTDPARISEIVPSSPEQRGVVELAERFSCRSAVIVPAPSSGQLSRVGVLCLGSSTPGFFDDDGGFVVLKVAARALAMELHQWWIGQLRRELLTTAHLVEEDLVLLRLERQGVGTKAIASRLDATENSINSRFQRITLRLGVANRKAAAAVAAEYGLI